MSKRILLAFVVVGCLASPAPAVAATLSAQFFPHTGEIRLRNENTVPVPIVFYSIESASSALIPAEWLSIEDQYDLSGNGFVDPNGEWTVISATSMELAEGALDADGGRLLPQRAISLGRIWNPATTAITDFTFTARETSEEPINVFTKFGLDGDYFPDSVVNQTDYAIWRQYFGSTSVLLADGNLDGTVNAADYVVWRNNLGLTISASGSGGSSAALSVAAHAVPEPGTVVLVLAALAGLSLTAAANRARQVR